jgi:hypothetical protein
VYLNRSPGLTLQHFVRVKAAQIMGVTYKDHTINGLFEQDDPMASI